MYIRKLLNTKKTIFSTDDLGKLLEITDRNYLYVTVNRLVKRGDLMRLSRGIYTHTMSYNKMELANKLKTPSYVSLETILYKSGVIFQPYESTITSVSDSPSQKEIGEIHFSYKQIKGEILTNPFGVISDGVKVFATPERAVLDLFYLCKNVYLDNIEVLNKEKLYNLALYYPKRVQQEVKKIC